jgi:hypothetical protein
LRQYAGALDSPRQLWAVLISSSTARLVLIILSMMDVIYLAATGAFFAIALSYVWGCIRL